MPNTHKIDIVEQLTNKFDSSSGIYFTCYTGMNVVQATELRKQFRESGVDYLVSKNTLTKLAATNAGYKDKLNDFFKGQVGIAYADKDPASPARVIKNYQKEYKDTLDRFTNKKIFMTDKNGDLIRDENGDVIKIDYGY